MAIDPNRGPRPRLGGINPNTGLRFCPMCSGEHAPNDTCPLLQPRQPDPNRPDPTRPVQAGGTASPPTESGSGGGRNPGGGGRRTPPARPPGPSGGGTSPAPTMDRDKLQLSGGHPAGHVNCPRCGPVRGVERPTTPARRLPARTPALSAEEVARHQRDLEQARERLRKAQSVGGWRSVLESRMARLEELRSKIDRLPPLQKRQYLRQLDMLRRQVDEFVERAVVGLEKRAIETLEKTAGKTVTRWGVAAAGGPVAEGVASLANLVEITQGAAELLGTLSSVSQEARVLMGTLDATIKALAAL